MRVAPGKFNPITGVGEHTRPGCDWMRLEFSLVARDTGKYLPNFSVRSMFSAKARKTAREARALPPIVRPKVNPGKRVPVRLHLISVIAKHHAPSQRDPLPLRHLDFKWFTTSLIPAFSPRRRRIVRHSLENSRDWICRTVIRQTRTSRQLFPLLGERIKGEGGRQNQIHSGNRPSQNEFRQRAVQVRNAPVFAPVFTALRRGG